MGNDIGKSRQAGGPSASQPTQGSTPYSTAPSPETSPGTANSKDLGTPQTGPATPLEGRAAASPIAPPAQAPVVEPQQPVQQLPNPQPIQRLDTDLLLDLLLLGGQLAQLRLQFTPSKDATAARSHFENFLNLHEAVQKLRDLALPNQSPSEKPLTCTLVLCITQITEARVFADEVLVPFIQILEAYVQTQTAAPLVIKEVQAIFELLFAIIDAWVRQGESQADARLVALLLDLPTARLRGGLVQIAESTHGQTILANFLDILINKLEAASESQSSATGALYNKRQLRERLGWGRLSWNLDSSAEYQSQLFPEGPDSRTNLSDQEND